MNDLQLFSNPEFGKLHMIEIDGKPHAAATDVAKMLGYVDPHGAISRHCRYPCKRRVPHPQSPNKTIEINFIPEGDLYRLIVNSQLPTAERFEIWVFDEVIPSIVKTGGYNLPQLTPNEIILQLAQANVQLEKEVEEVRQEVRQLGGKFDTAMKAFTAPSIDHWKADMNDKINEMVDTYSRSPSAFRGMLYSETEQTANVLLQSRLKRMRDRLKRQGVTYKERMALTKLDVISKDKQLRPIFEGIVKKYQAIYSQD